MSPSRKRRRAIAVLAKGERIQLTPFGTYMAVWNKKGQPRERKCFSTQIEAREWLERRRTDGPAPPLTSAQYAAAQTAIALLPPGVSLVDAARAFVKAAAPKAAAVRFSDAVAEFIRSRRPLVTQASVDHYQLALDRLCDALGNPSLAGVTPRQIAEFLDGTSPSARNHALSDTSPFFTWAVRQGYIVANPCASVERARMPEPPRGVLTVDQASALLHGAAKHAPDLVPAIATALFTGVRPAELQRIGSLCFGPEYLRLDGKVTKAARARTCPIRPNLRAWLDKYPPAPSLCPEGYQDRLRRLRLKLKLPWPHDCLRHSFATYAYELTHDAAAVAAEMGHRGTDIFFRHYRALANPGDGARFFAIAP